MELTDLLSLDQWKELERDISNQYGLDVNVFNPVGFRITDFKCWANKLCPAIKDTDKGQSFICAVAHMNISALAKQSGQPVIEECDAGLMKLVVPIIRDGEYLGAIGACGKVLDDSEPDTFLINKITDIPEESLEALAKTVSSLERSKAVELARYIETRLEELIPQS